MGTSNASLIMTLVNSIIGVSILAMPFCYKQCGILLATLILIFSNLMTRLSCYYLLKSAIMTRRRTFELLAFHALGPAGKTVIELSIILLMIGTCIAFFVVMGDLSPPIIGSLLELKMTTALRPAVLLGLAFFVVLPLGLLRNVDSLSSICTASFLFYLFLVFKVFIECTNNLFSGSWIDEVHFWRPAGILQCLPIFSMALSCQTQLLEVFDSATNCSLDRINSIVKAAVNLCTGLYISVGFFGYVAFYKQTFSGNLLVSFSESYFSEFIKLGFVLSVAVTFPLVIFPCRASLHSLLFKKAHVPHYELVTGGGNHIPEAHFKCITFFIITASLSVGLLAPNIEIVLGLLGSTIGVIICYLCPPILFICISSKATTEKVLAQFLCAVGLFIMIMGTYANLYLSEPGNDVKANGWKPIEQDLIKSPLDAPLKQIEPKLGLPIETKDVAQPAVAVRKKPPDLQAGEVPREVEVLASGQDHQPREDKRNEPPVPQAPVNSKEAVEQRPAVVVAEGKAKPIEPPVPAAAAGNQREEKVAPKNLVPDEEKKRVEPAVPVDPAAASVGAIVAAAASPAPASLSKNIANSADAEVAANKVAENVAGVPSAAAAPKLLSSGEKRLLSEQQEVLQRMRGAKTQDKLVDDNPRVEQQPKKGGATLEKRVAPVSGHEKVDSVMAAGVAGVAPKSAQQRAQGKPPLPLLKQAIAKEEQKIDSGGGHGGGDSAPKRDILENEAPDREKRDLYFVTHLPEERENEFVIKSDADASSSKVNEKLLVPVNVKQPDRANAAEKPESDDANENLTCDKDGNPEVSAEKSKIYSQSSSSLDAKPVAAAPGAVESPKLVPLSEKVNEEPKADSDVHKLSSNTNKNSAPVKSVDTDHKMESIMIAPSKLSDPIVRLPERIPIDDKLKPSLLNVMKPQSRDLKTVKDKLETIDEKK